MIFIIVVSLILSLGRGQVDYSFKASFTWVNRHRDKQTWGQSDTHNWRGLITGLFLASEKEREKDAASSSQWSQTHYPQLQSLGTSAPPCQLGDPAEAHWTAPKAFSFTSPAQQLKKKTQPAIHQNNFNLYSRTTHTHICQQAVWFFTAHIANWAIHAKCALLEPSRWRYSESCCVTTLCCCHSISNSLTVSHNSHFPHPDNSHEVGSHARLSSCRRREAETEWWKKEGSAEDKQRVIDVNLGKTQSLKPFKHTVQPPLQKTATDLSICSWRGEKR